MILYIVYMYEYYSSLFPYVNAYVQYIPVYIPYRVTLIKDSKFERTYIGTSIYQYILYIQYIPVQDS